MTRPLPRFVNAFTAKGRRYYYFRRPGVKPIRLPDFGTPEFEVAYQKALHADGPGDWLWRAPCPAPSTPR